MNSLSMFIAKTFRMDACLSLEQQEFSLKMLNVVLSSIPVKVSMIPSNPVLSDLKKGTRGIWGKLYPHPHPPPPKKNTNKQTNTFIS